MQLDLALAIFHHLLIFVLFGILAGEIVLVAPGITAQGLKRLASIDLWYGIVALAIVAAGFARAIFAAKGWGYYSSNSFFWAKIGVFILIALLSIFPTRKFIQWRQIFRGTGALPAASSIASVKSVLWLETILFALLPIFAAAMARGYGQPG